MRLLIVVDKLLTGFDAPSTTYLYIDKQMRDHGTVSGHLPGQSRLVVKTSNTAT